LCNREEEEKEEGVARKKKEDEKKRSKILTLNEENLMRRSISGTCFAFPQNLFSSFCPNLFLCFYSKSVFLTLLSFKIFEVVKVDYL